MAQIPLLRFRRGAKLYKNFAQKLLAVSLCAAIAQLGVPITICVAEATIVASGICGKTTFLLNQA